MLDNKGWEPLCYTTGKTSVYEKMDGLIPKLAYRAQAWSPLGFSYEMSLKETQNNNKDTRNNYKETQTT